MSKSKTLYLSDLDGTLLGADEKLSDFTRKTLEKLIENGMLFSYATARSFATARLCTAGLNAKIPLIVHNGTFVIDNQTGNILHKNAFLPTQAKAIVSLLSQYQIHPIVYSLIDQQQRFSYDKTAISPETWQFILTRKGDGRERTLFSEDRLLDGEVFYFACIDQEKRLYPAWKKLTNPLCGLSENTRCVYQKDIYSGHQWLEIMPKNAGKAYAARILKTMLHADRLVVFGDGINDLPLFEAGDESYAVANAVPALKECATGVILSNIDDGVAHWLNQNSGFYPL